LNSSQLPPPTSNKKKKKNGKKGGSESGGKREEGGMRCYHCQKEVKEEEIEYFMETTKTSLNILNNSRGNTDEHISGLEGFMNELVLSSSGRSSSSDQFCLHPSHHLSLNTSLRLAQQHRLRGDVLSAIRLTRTNLEAMSGWLIIGLYLVWYSTLFLFL